MANTILLKRSSTASSVPTAGQLSAGELAINTLDEKIFFKNSSGTVKSLSAMSDLTSNLVTISTTQTITGSKTFSLDVTMSGDLAVNGGDITTSAATATLFNSGATTLSIGGAATTFTLGYASTAASTLNISTGAVAASTTKTINIGTGGAASSTTNINLGPTSGLGTITLNKNLSFSSATSANIASTASNAYLYSGAASILIGDQRTASSTIQLGSPAPNMGTSIVTLFGANGSASGFDITEYYDGIEYYVEMLFAGTQGLVFGTTALYSPVTIQTTGVLTLGDAGLANGTQIAVDDSSSSISLYAGNGASIRYGTELRFLENAINGSNYVGFKAPAALAANKVWVLPTADGTANQVLKTDGSGNLGWATAGGSAAGSNTYVQFNDGGTAFGGTADLAFDKTGRILSLGNSSAGYLNLKQQGEVRFSDADSSNYVALKSPATVSSNVTWTMPATDGAAGQILKTDGAGALSWISPGISVYSSSTDYVTTGRLSADQTILNNGNNQLVSFIAENDPQSWWNATTKRFTPTIAGYYLVNFAGWWATGAINNNQNNLQIAKNGNTYAINVQVIDSNTSKSVYMSRIIYMNGSSDYIEFTAYTSNTTSQALQYGGTAYGQGTSFGAVLLTNTTPPAVDQCLYNMGIV